MNNFPQYSVEYISGVMSLRKPQIESLKILANILDNIHLDKNINLSNALNNIHKLYPICSNFEHNFLSLAFSLATGVGKTRLMGAFIAYLYTKYNIKNFFVVAPNTTIYEKLKNDLGNPNNPKYVFSGIGCFTNPPQIITDDDYKTKQLSFFQSDIRIFVYNIDKFNKENVNMKKVNEIIGDSFYQYLSNLKDLVLIMDESHHYRAEKGALALSELNPIIGLELTATPLFTKGSKQIPFKNVVYEYPLSRAIEDGYTRTPFAVTRSDIDFFNFGDEELDKMMLIDGITCHENTKNRLKFYANNHNKKIIKPFMLVVCKDTEPAKWIYNFICSNNFREGKYKNKTILIHSKQKNKESEENIRLLISVEDPYNLVEIVIHVNMLKEGWDVNNLYTIVPLRTASSKILREQMVGRGLRLPYGERTGDKYVDSVMLTAHDKFNDILEEAQKSDSIFKIGNIIKVEEISKDQLIYTEISIDNEPLNICEKAYKYTNIPKSHLINDFFIQTDEIIKQETSNSIQNDLLTIDTNKIVDTVKNHISENKELKNIFTDNQENIIKWINHQTEETSKKIFDKFIPIPRTKIIQSPTEKYIFADFDIDISNLKFVPVSSEILIQNLENRKERIYLKGDILSFEGFNHKKAILEELRKKPEIDYEKCSELLFKLINQICDYYIEKYRHNGMQNIVMLHKYDIANEIYKQMLFHFYREDTSFQIKVLPPLKYNIKHAYNFTKTLDLYDEVNDDIRTILFTGIKKGVFNSAKFDSKIGELALARILEIDQNVIKWLRPHSNEFTIKYNSGNNYEPDFVIETEDKIYLTEVKGEDKINNPDVIAKKQSSLKYCEIVSKWCKENGYKEWKYLFIPSLQIKSNSTFIQLAERFVVSM